MKDSSLRANLFVTAAGILMVSVSAQAFAQSDKVIDLLSSYEKTGEAMTCLPLHSVRDTDVVDDYALLVETNGAVYLNELNGRCAGLAREERYSRQSSTNSMCRGDIIRVVNSFGHTLGSCSLGAFEKLKTLPETE